MVVKLLMDSMQTFLEMKGIQIKRKGIDQPDWSLGCFIYFNLQIAVIAVSGVAFSDFYGEGKERGQ